MDITRTYKPKTPATPDLILEVSKLSRVVDSRALVDSVSLSVKTGDVLAITGPSGAGKSSLLRLLNRLDEPTAGQVTFRGNNYRDLAPPVLRRQIGMVMQSPNLFSGTVRQNILFGPAQRGQVVKDSEIQNLLDQVGLSGYAEQNVETLSGGESQRVSFARTLANTPEVLLLDEPTAALDEESALGIERLILNVVAASKMTCLIVTHNLAQASRIAPKTVYMEHGSVKHFGPTSEVLNAIESH